VIGTLHPRLVQTLGLASAPVLFELDVQGVSQHTLARYRTLSKFPAVRRDLAFVVAIEVAAGAVKTAMQNAAPPLVHEIEVFDDYRGKGLAENQKSLALRVVMQDTARTLTDEEVEETVAGLTRIVTGQFNANLRA
jgi:phenylalanyl-tRNA synthetase beta chain